MDPPREGRTKVWPSFSGSVVIGVLAAALLASVGPGVAEAIRDGGRARVVVAFRRAPAAEVGGLSLASLEAAASLKRASLGRLAPGDFQASYEWPALAATAGLLSAEGLARLASDPDVLRIDLDVGGSGNLSVSVPFIRADLAHAQGLTGRGVTAAVLDSGVATQHPDIADDLVAQHCFCQNSDGTGCCPNGQTEQDGSGAAEDEAGHGTNVTGILTSGGRVAPLGVAPDTKIVAVRVLDRNDVFSGAAQVVSGLNWILANRPDVRIVNMSLGTSARFAGACDSATAFTMAFGQAIDALRARGTSVFVSSGNDGSTTSMEAPACIASAISVAAVYKANVGPVTILGCSDTTTAPDQVTCFSNTNAQLKLLGPGAPIVSAGLGGGRSTYFGTSQASPHAAGVAALMLQSRPTLTPAQIESTLEQTGHPIIDTRSGLTFPRIDALAAVQAVGGGGPSTCVTDATTLCLNANRYRVTAAWTSPTQSGQGQAAPLTSDTGYFWFFNSANVEMVVKVLNGCSINSRYWVFAGGLTNVAVTLTITDTQTGSVVTRLNPQSTPFQPIQDTAAFSTCP